MQRGPGFDRDAPAPGQTPMRPLLNIAAFALSNTPKEPSSQKEFILPSNNETIQYQNGFNHSSKNSSTASRFLKGVSKLVPHRHEVRLSVDSMWNTAVNHLRNDDVELARKIFEQIRRMRDKDENMISIGYIKAVSVLAVLSVIDEWYRQTTLTNTASKRITDAVTVGSTDAIALSVRLYFRHRWSCPSNIPIEHICNLLEKSASQGHAASQAVFGKLLCRLSSNTLNSSEPGYDLTTDKNNDKNVTNQAAKEVEIKKTKSNNRKQNKKKARSIPVLSNKTCGSVWIKQAASQGYFFALDELEEHLIRSVKCEKASHKDEKTSHENNSKESLKLPLDCITEEEYYSLVCNGAEAFIPDCSLRMSRLTRKGLGCTKDKSGGFEWLKKAADLNLPSAVSAVHAEITRKNMKLTDIIAESSETVMEEDDREQRKRALRIAQLRRNREAIQSYEEQMTVWRKEDPQLRKILLLYRICNLQTKIPFSLSKALLRFIFERDRDGWYVNMVKS